MIGHVARGVPQGPVGALCRMAPVDLLVLFSFALIGLWFAKSRLQQQRVALLAHHLSNHSVERHIKTLSEGYLRALGEAEPGRREQVWNLLRSTEQALCREMRQLARDFAGADAGLTRVSKLAIWLPGSTSYAGTFDMREALHVHARGICRAVDDASGASARDRAFAISAEMLLMQHTCHWFCRSKSVASARMRANHGTPYAQVVGAVLPQTRTDYLALTA